MQSKHSDELESIECLAETINKLRKTVRIYLDSNCNESALFWADKAATMSNAPRDIYWLVQSMYRCGEYIRAVALVKNKGLDKNQPLFQLISGLCYFNAGKYNEALLVLTRDSSYEGTDGSASVVSLASFLNIHPITNNHILEGFTPDSLHAALLALKGRIYEKLDKRSCAVECFKLALKYDVCCYDAFQSLIQHQMLTAAEEKELMSSLPFKDQCSSHDILPFVYEELLKKYHHSSPVETSSKSCKHASQIVKNLDLQEAHAERLFYACAFKNCYKVTEEILKADPFHKRTLPIHISCLVELKKPNQLFYLAHELVDLAPDRAISWYAVGCYYFSITNFTTARRHLSKAIYLDKYFGPSWLAYGHSFAEQKEHDQAMAAYFSAAQLMKGCHLPVLYVGAECGLINNIKLAEKFIAQAHSMAPNDPFVFHEMGTVAYQNEDYTTAEKQFLTALVEVQKINSQILAEKWEPLLNNLGHTFRKEKKYTESLRYHRLALSLMPENPSTLASIAFVQALQKNFLDSIHTFHKVLSFKQDDTFSLTMFSYLLDQLVDVTPAFHDIHVDQD